MFKALVRMLISTSPERSTFLYLSLNPNCRPLIMSVEKPNGFHKARRSRNIHGLTGKHNPDPSSDCALEYVTLVLSLVLSLIEKQSVCILITTPYRLLRTEFQHVFALKESQI